MLGVGVIPVAAVEDRGTTTIGPVSTRNERFSISLDAVIVAVTNDVPRLLAVNDSQSGLPSIPSAPLDIEDDTTLDRGMRRAIKELTSLDVNYVEQLYTFGDAGRRPDATRGRAISVAYLALIQETAPAGDAQWVDWYELLPWEDHREGRPDVLEEIDAALGSWAAGDAERRERVAIAFAESWDGIRVLDRYEILYQAGLSGEYYHDHDLGSVDQVVGQTMPFDHRRIAATALGRVRGKFTYRPVVFELLAETFTLLELQRCVEALAGVRLHKQNFRRLVENSGLVEGTGSRASRGGRPAELFRYRPEVQLERPRPGLGQPYR
jgi:hypothetical protein